MIEEMKNLVESFNEMMKEKVREKFSSLIDGYKRFLDESGNNAWIYNDYTEGEFIYDYDYENIWVEFAGEQDGVQPLDAINYYRENREKFINDDELGRYVKQLSYECDVEAYCFRVGECSISVKNPFYASSGLVKDGQYVILAGCIDTQVMIGKDDKLGFDDLDYAVAIGKEHLIEDFGEISVYLVQRCVDSYGVIFDKLIKCVECGWCDPTQQDSGE